jgi:hypothetical protein
VETLGADDAFEERFVKSILIAITALHGTGHDLREFTFWKKAANLLA